ncbi:hypothetical protein [uncultured Thiodictyon sp.]|uniref:hypothetical protein n=1 Tax=uncultured Thiodictyon sp. TaxID=1846217 RepID=UPI0025FB27CF|nr:hypothetical protein [uncultured Thiodictyon sp.]
MVSTLTLNAENHAETIRRLNTAFFLAARDAARESVPFAMTAFGVPQVLAEWLLTAGPDQVLALAQLPVCTFEVRLPSRAMETVCLPGGRVPVETDCPVVAMHTALLAVGAASERR